MTPLDTIRARYQLSTKKLSVKDVIKELWSNEGYKGFYKGLTKMFLISDVRGNPIFDRQKCRGEFIITCWKCITKNM